MSPLDPATSLHAEKNSQVAAVLLSFGKVSWLTVIPEEWEAWLVRSRKMAWAV